MTGERIRFRARSQYYNEPVILAFRDHRAAGSDRGSQAKLPEDSATRS